MCRDRRGDPSTDDTPRTGNSGLFSVTHRLLNTASQLTDRYDALSFLDELYWKIDTAYCLLRIALCGGVMSVRIGGETVQFGLSTRSEYRRATDLGGERAVIEALLAELRGSETVWDIGACIGTYTCPVASALTTGSVVGFEPEPTNRSRLRRNLERNAFTADWTVSSVALSDHDGTCTLSSEFVAAGAGHHHLSLESNGSTVETKRGDSLVKDGVFTPPGVIKMDVQGAELQVLRGLQGILTEVRSLYLEVHSNKCRRYGTTAEEIEAFLTRAGFSITVFGPPTNRRSGVYLVHAQR
ncbi:FkbM family methyltransferase [Halocatena salina]|uniref:FkbM family methyltransferase n=1 Tax=Halocatena salina TaxID=2934340 RepID=A0A8U0A8U1_9EURY|nr:FkbM family methyltransferase [Halocatena salina]UPM44443.1 FkbM family methyltransferase [Halocatena salina]